VGGAADMSDLTLPDQQIQGGQGFFLGNGEIGAMEKINIDVIRFQATQAALAAFQYMMFGITPVIGSVSHGLENFGGNKNVLSFSIGRKGFTDDALAFSPSINIGTVQYVDAGINGRIDDFKGLVFIGLIAEVHGTQYQFGNFQTRSAQSSVIHLYILQGMGFRLK
jgi:hypothetical protein